MDDHRLPHGLPTFSKDLVKQLEELNPRPVVEHLLTGEEAIQELVFQAGRRSVIDELVRLADAPND